ncbi:hypothetical protein [Verrucomicrobium spinosum]|uniref:hypothetical protein n=1 Tax=Verrucomicrobium spinosum TaxID=2736 RepID=UPI00094639D2|nr:hypothetical protein [Verrucomicrobium spinosum]
MPRPDLVTSGVVIRYERGGLQVSAGGMRPAQLVDDYPDGADATAMDAIVQTITVGRNDVAVPGLAERLFESYSGLIWEGGMALVQEDCNTGLRPGMSVNVTGGQVAWETMQAFIQSVSEDLMSGQTTVEFGLPQFCGARPRLFHLTRRRHNDQDKDADAAGEERLELLRWTKRHPRRSHCMRRR